MSASTREPEPAVPATTRDDEPVLSVRNLHIELRSSYGVGDAVSGVSFDVGRGESLGLVGESGSGKSLTASAILQLLPQPMAAVSGGSIRFNGDELLDKSPREMRRVRGKQISMVLQDPLGALNPAFTVGHQLKESLRLHTKLKGDGLTDRAVELLDLMQIPHPRERLSSFPHQFSGGMNQRVVGSIAIAGEPELLIADEPTTALDVTVQAAYLELLHELQVRRGMSMIFITHDLSVVRAVSDRVAVMYAGRLAEVGPGRSIFQMPSHPYTRALMESVPDIRKPPSELVTIGGSPPSIYDQPSGCRFRPRCWLYRQLDQPERCASEVPELQPVPDGPDQFAACHFPTDAMASSPADAPAAVER